MISVTEMAAEKINKALLEQEMAGKAKASLRLVLAAFVVRLLDAVAAHIPMNPAKAEHIAPKTKAKAIIP